MPKADSVSPRFVGLSRKEDLDLPGNSLVLFFPREIILLIPVGAENCAATVLQSWSSAVFVADLVLRNRCPFPSSTAASCKHAVVAKQDHPCLKWSFSFIRLQPGDAIIFSCCLSVLHWKACIPDDISLGINEMIYCLYLKWWKKRMSKNKLSFPLAVKVGRCVA